VRCSLSQLAHDLQTTLSSCGSYLSLIYHQLSLSAINEFLDNQRDELDFPGDTYLWFLYLPILWVFIYPVGALALPLNDIATSSIVEVHASHVPTFYAPDTTSSADGELLFGIILPVVAATFGALHCIAWNFHFPSDVEQLLWRIGSLTITLIPPASACIAFIIAALCFLLDFLEKKYDFRFSLPQCVDTAILYDIYAGGVPRRCSTRCIYACTSFASHAGDYVVEAATRECFLCDQLGEFSASHMSLRVLAVS